MGGEGVHPDADGHGHLRGRGRGDNAAGEGKLLEYINDFLSITYKYASYILHCKYNDKYVLVRIVPRRH